MAEQSTQISVSKQTRESLEPIKAHFKDDTGVPPSSLDQVIIYLINEHNKARAIKEEKS